MQKIKRQDQYLMRIIEAIEKIESYTVKMKSNDLMALDACLMQLIHIGEIMNKLIKHNKDFVLTGIETHRIVGLRNFAAHDYL